MIRQYLIIGLVVPFLFLFSFCLGNNVKLNGAVKVTDVTAGVATLEVSLSWDNSWRDDYNWDAVWLFLKYRPSNSGDWLHMNLQNMQFTATNGCEVMNAKSGSNITGVYVYRGSKGTSKKVTTKVTLQWNCGTGYTKSSFDENKIFLLAQAIEMVYIPYGAYYVGDVYSNQSLLGPDAFKVDDIAARGMSYSASTVYNTSYSVDKAVDGTSGYWRSGRTNEEEWWQVDFGEPRQVKFFYVGVVYAVLYGHLEGSNTGAAGDWTILWSGAANCWPVGSSYQNGGLLKIEHPGSYRYYRVRMKSSSYSGIYTLYLQEKDLHSGIIYNEDQVTLTLLNSNTRYTVPASFPKAYKGYYIMKYELSQEQYVTFLNSLKREQQEVLLGASWLSGLSVGNYIFGDPSSPSCRNGIVLRSNNSGYAYIFDSDLNGNGVFGEDGDGQCIACNYMSLNDMLAYAAWSGLRPMSELEYERACRLPFPQQPQQGEYAWNSHEGISAVTSLTASGKASEKANNGSNVNVHHSLPPLLLGPVRCGIFARSGSFQQLAGATYYGVMEMSGNLQECVAAISYNGFSSQTNGDGSFKTSLWTTSPSYYGVRGGSFAGGDSLLRVSDRSGMTNYFATVSQRDSSVGFRLVRTLEDGLVSVSPGVISLNGPLCPRGESTVTEVTPASVDGRSDLAFTYVWSVKVGSAAYVVLPGESGNTLTYYDFLPNTAYQFKRTAICALGEASVETNSITSLESTVISIQPRDTNTLCGFTVSVTAKGASLSYQWRKDGIEIASSNAATYTKSSAVEADAGEYRCQVTGSCGTVFSEAAMVVLGGLVDGTMTDPRDGQIYKTRIMPDGHEWMIENLRFGVCDASKFNSYKQSNIQNQIADGYYGVCILSPVEKGGNLYNWQAAMNASNAAYNTSGNPSGNVNGNSKKQWQGICPDGWHLPSGGSTGELQQLYTALCNLSSRMYPGTKTFEGVLGGYGNGNSVSSPGGYGYYWSSTFSSNTSAYCLYFTGSYTYPQAGEGKYYGLSVRCVKDYNIN